MNFIKTNHYKKNILICGGSFLAVLVFTNKQWVSDDSMNCHKDAFFFTIVLWYSGSSLIFKILYLIFNVLCTTRFIQNVARYPVNSPNTHFGEHDLRFLQNPLVTVAAFTFTTLSLPFLCLLYLSFSLSRAPLIMREILPLI